MPRFPEALKILNSKAYLAGIVKGMSLFNIASLFAISQAV
jgi:hypothetical protein